jgi:hypothetical protein
MSVFRTLSPVTGRSLAAILFWRLGTAALRLFLELSAVVSGESKLENFTLYTVYFKFIYFQKQRVVIVSPVILKCFQVHNPLIVTWYTVKKRLAIFPSPAGTSLTKLSLAGKIVNLFFTV